MSNLADAYILANKTLSPDQLLLDPNNPRIVLNIDHDANYTSTELASDEVQKYIFGVVDRKEYNVTKLIESIANDGFLDQGDRMMVKKIEGTNKYKVLEGNRRLTAVRHLLEAPDTLTAEVLRSLQQLPVKELLIKNNAGFTSDEIELKLLGMIHLTGHLEWGAMERAHYIYKYYMQILKHEGVGRFEHSASIIESVQKFFNISAREIKKQLIIYRVYQQLRKYGYMVRLNHYSLIDLAVKTRRVKDRFFELDQDNLKFSETGLEHFANLCIDEKRIIHNPRDFKKFTKVFINGTEAELQRLLSKSWDLDQIIDRIDARNEANGFRRKLEQVRDTLSSLQIVECRGTKYEIELLEKIEKLVSKTKIMAEN